MATQLEILEQQITDLTVEEGMAKAQEQDALRAATASPHDVAAREHAHYAQKRLDSIRSDLALSIRMRDEQIALEASNDRQEAKAKAKEVYARISALLKLRVKKGKEVDAYLAGFLKIMEEWGDLHRALYPEVVSYAKLAENDAQRRLNIMIGVGGLESAPLNTIAHAVNLGLTRSGINFGSAVMLHYSCDNGDVLDSSERAVSKSADALLLGLSSLGQGLPR